jgi:hypothetical protein
MAAMYETVTALEGEQVAAVAAVGDFLSSRSRLREG